MGNFTSPLTRNCLSVRLGSISSSCALCPSLPHSSKSTAASADCLPQEKQKARLRAGANLQGTSTTPANQCPADLCGISHQSRRNRRLRRPIIIITERHLFSFSPDSYVPTHLGCSKVATSVFPGLDSRIYLYCPSRASHKGVCCCRPQSSHTATLQS